MVDAADVAFEAFIWFSPTKIWSTFVFIMIVLVGGWLFFQVTWDDDGTQNRAGEANLETD